MPVAKGKEKIVMVTKALRFLVTTMGALATFAGNDLLLFRWVLWHWPSMLLMGVVLVTKGITSYCQIRLG